MFVIRQCNSEEDFSNATELSDELTEWDISETQKLGVSASEVLQFYYPTEAATKVTLLAFNGATPAACIGYREISPCTCELKRLYVRPKFRGTGLGAMMIASLTEKAATDGYSSICLETARFMQTAMRLYEDAGFVQCGPYYDIPATFHDISVFMRKDISAFSQVQSHAP